MFVSAKKTSPKIWQVDSAAAWLSRFVRQVRQLADAEHGKTALVVVHEDNRICKLAPCFLFCRSSLSDHRFVWGCK